jgi:AcrR family transcriptional regulator
MRPRLTDARREELLDGVMRIICARGFAEVQISEVARELHCSVATLYKIAPSKDSLVLLAIRRWGDMARAARETRAARGTSASDRARAYFQEGAASIRVMSFEYFRDVQRFESTRAAWLAIVDDYIDRFVELVEDAQAAGEVRRVNTRFLGEMLRQVGFVTRDEHVLAVSGLNHEQGVLEVDRIVWEGISTPRKAGTGAATSGTGAHGG